MCLPVVAARYQESGVLHIKRRNAEAHVIEVLMIQRFMKVLKLYIDKYLH